MDTRTKELIFSPELAKNACFFSFIFTAMPCMEMAYQDITVLGPMVPNDNKSKLSVLDALGGTRDACLLVALFFPRPVLLGPTLPPSRAPRPELPVVFPGFGFDKSIFNKTCDN